MRSLTWLAGSLPLALACGGLVEVPADVDHPETYASDVLTFDYPGNWSISTDHDPDANLELAVDVESSATRSAWAACACRTS